MDWRSKSALLGLACAAGIPVANADVSFHGYGQAVVGTTFSNTRALPFQSGEYAADPSFTPESNFALQASTNIGSSFTAVTQILAQGAQDFQPKFHWAYLKYEFNDTFALKAGRLQLPYYQYSDYFYVGEAYPWIVPPEAVYINQITNFDGLNLNAQQNIGNWYLFWQFIYGALDNTANVPATANNPEYNLAVTAKNIFGASLDVTYNEWLSLRAAVFGEKLSVTGEPAVDQIVNDLYAQGYNEAAKNYALFNDPVVYYTAGLQLTPSQWVIIAEFAGLQHVGGSSSWLTQTESEYLSVGHHFGKWLPMLTFGHRNQWMSTKSAQSVPASPLDPTGYDTVANSQFNGRPFYYVIEAQSMSPSEREKDYYYEFTLRYDLTSNVALKLDWTYYQTHYKTSDYLLSTPIGPVSPGFSNPPDANRLSAAVTFSF
jgi:hypothetical protein